MTLSPSQQDFLHSHTQILGRTSDLLQCVRFQSPPGAIDATILGILGRTNDLRTHQLLSFCLERKHSLLRLSSVNGLIGARELHILFTQRP